LPESFGPVSAAAGEDHPAALRGCAQVRFEAQERMRIVGDDVELLLGVSFNASGRRIEILYTGPVTGMLSMTNEYDCALEPMVVRLPPGTYRVLVRVAGFDEELFAASAEPVDQPLQMYGEWQLRAGHQYFECFRYDWTVTFD